MALNYAGLHLVAENFVTRPKSDQPYTNKLADTIHGASAYVIPHRVENRHRQQIEALCGSPQIQRIRTIMANSRASFGASAAAEPPAAEAPPAAIPPTPKQAKSAAKQASRNLSVEAQEARTQERKVRQEVNAAIAEARRLSTAKKAAKTPAATSSAKGDVSSAGFLTAKGSAKTAKKVAFTAPTPRALTTEFERATESPPSGGGGSAAAAAPPTPSPASAVTASRADSINATIAQVEGAAGRVKVVPTSKEGKGAKGFQPAYVGDDGVARGYKSADVTEDQLAEMIAEFTRVRDRLTDKKEKQDVTNFISRIKKEKESR